jgi:phospholipase C
MSRIRRRHFLKFGAAAAAVSGCGIDERRVRFPSVSLLGGVIRHFVVLMMENRSYDEMLGSLPGRKYAGPPAGTSLRYRTPDGRSASVPLRHGTPRNCFYPDPPHRFAKVTRQIYGSGPDAPADMSGFAQTFAEEKPLVRAAAASVEDYATHYADGKLPVLQTLAKEYGVCTHWFASVPAATTPNRMFAHAGTSGGATAQGAYYSRVRGKMIFDALGKNPWLWRVYYHDAPHLWLTGDFWTKTFASQLRRVHRFREDVQNDALPVYTFIEPRHIVAPWNSQHPFMGVSHGEELIASVYNDLISNPRVFEKTLLLVVYDEHGGFFDHVVPPGHRGWQPEGIDHDVIAPSAPASDGFDFTMLGPRVPAVVVSPWIERGSAFGWNADSPADQRTFDHTSILATVGRMTGTWVASPRARAATPLEVTINRTSPRTDASTITYRGGDYDDRGDQRIAAASGGEPHGVADELCQAWREEHRKDATPERIVAYYDDLVQHSGGSRPI